jgi:hypothetical protein
MGALGSIPYEVFHKPQPGGLMESPAEVPRADFQSVRPDEDQSTAIRFQIF